MAKEMNFEALQANLKMIDKKGEMAYEQAKAAGTLTPEQEKFSALMSDEAFLSKLFASDSAEKAQTLLRENGVELSVEEINAFGKYIAEVSKKLIENGGELSEEELEEIAGGGFSIGEWTGISVAAVPGGIVGSIAGTCVFPGVGTAIGAAVGAAITGGICAFFTWLTK